MADNWFTALLRDGFALTAVGGTAPFARLGIGVLRASLDGLSLTGSVDDANEHIMGGFDELPVHKNVRCGIPALGVLDTRLVTFSNGAAIVALRLLERARLGEYFERALSVEDAGVWKPAPGATPTQPSNATSNQST